MRNRRRTVIAMLNDPESSTVAFSQPETPQRDNEMATKTKPKPKPKKRKAGPRTKPQSQKSVEESFSTPSEPTVFERLRRRVFHPRLLVVIAAVIAAIIFIPRITRWLPDAGARNEYQLAAAEIEITAPPRHVPVDLVEQVVKNAKLRETLSLLDDDLAERVAKAFRGHPWVAEVVQVRKSFPARIEVELKFREPVAMVAVTDGLYPIDANAILLPPIDFSVADARRYPVIRGVQSLPHGAEGRPWNDPAVTGAAQLAEMLRPHWKKLSLAAIRLPRRTTAEVDPKNLTFELETRGGSRILWGRAPGTDHPGELKTKQKIGRLEKYLADFGSFDYPHGPYEIDIRHWQEISRRPLSAAREFPTRR